jgi:acyl-CoA synthetase (AMP-forming)/AMP-acid ligase II
MSTTGAHSWKSIPAMSVASAQRFGDRVAVVDIETRLSHAALFDAARTFAAALVRTGIEPGDRVAVWSCNSAKWVIAALGVFQSGATLVPINTRFKGGEAADILLRSRARLLVTVTDFLGVDYVAMLRSTAGELPDLATIVVASGETPTRTLAWEDFLSGRLQPRSTRLPGASRRWAPTTRRTSCSPPGPRAVPKGS